MKMWIGLAVVLAFACTGVPEDNESESGPVTVTVRDGSGVAAGVRVLFYDDEFQLIADVSTDSTGRVTQDTPAGGAVTILTQEPLPNGGTFFGAQTTLDVQPGDELVTTQGADIGAIEVQVTLPGAVASANYYSVNVGCTSFGVTDGAAVRDASVPAWCVDGSGDVIISASAMNNSTGELLATTMMTVTPGSGTTPAALPAWNTNIVTAVVEGTNLPAGTDAAVGIAYGYLGKHILEPRQYSMQSMSGSTGTVSLDVPDAGDWSVRVFQARGSFGTLSMGQYLNQSAVPTVSFDFVNAFIPPLGSGSADLSNPMAPTITWSDDMSASDWGEAAIYSGATDQHYWVVEMPSTTASPLTLPELPADATEWIPASDSDGSLSFGASDPPASYDERRNYDPTQRVVTEHSSVSTSVSLQ